MVDNRMNAAVRIRIFLASLFVAVSGSCLASDLYGFFESFKPSLSIRAVWIAVHVVLLGIGAQLAGTVALRIFRFRTRRLNKSTAEPRRVLVWFLSPLPEPQPSGEGEPANEGLPTHVALTWDLKADLERLAEDKRLRKARGERPIHWNWEQPLRGLYHGRKSDGPLKRLILICSHESVCQLHLFARLVRRYESLRELTIEALVPDGHGVQLLVVEDHKWDGHWGWNFEDFDEMWPAVSQLIEHLTQLESVPEREIAIDLTGGPKPATVVAATATINREIRNQYVCTNPKDRAAAVWEYEVLEYDLELRFGR